MAELEYEQYIFSHFREALLVHSKETKFGTLRVYDFKDAPLRCLFLDAQFSSCINKKTGHSGLGYLKKMEEVLMHTNSGSQVLILGHGAGMLAKAALERGCIVTSVDIISELFPISLEYFQVPKSKNLTLITQDAHEFVEKNKDKFDLILVDIFVNAEDVPSNFKTKKWFSLLQKHLVPAGIVCMNYIGHDDKPADFMKLQGICQEVFPKPDFHFLEGGNHLHQNIIITLRNNP